MPVDVQWQEFKIATVFVVAGLFAFLAVLVYLLPKLIDFYKIRREADHVQNEAVMRRFDTTIQRLEKVVDNIIADAQQQREHCSQELALQRQHDEATQKSAWQSLERQGDRIETYVKTILDYLSKFREKRSDT